METDLERSLGHGIKNNSSRYSLLTNLLDIPHILDILCILLFKEFLEFPPDH